MKAGGLSLAAGGPVLVPVGTTWPVQTAVGTAPQVVYRRVFYLRVKPTGADDVVVDSASLRAVFSPVPATVPASALAKPSGEHGVVVALNAPRQVVRVDVAGGGGYSLHRVDGDKIVDAATVTASSGAALPAAFVAQRFAVRRQPNPAAELAKSSLQQIQLRTYPSGARFGLADAALKEPPDVFWRRPGEVLQKVDSGEVGAALATALRRRLAAAARPWPASVDVALVAESDAPCSLFFSAFNVGYHLVRERFRDDLRDRVVLRFGGGDEPAPVQAALPAGAQEKETLPWAGGAN